MLRTIVNRSIQSGAVGRALPAASRAFHVSGASFKGEGLDSYASDFKTLDAFVKTKLGDNASYKDIKAAVESDAAMSAVLENMVKSAGEYKKYGNTPNMLKPPKRVAITGAAGAIGYAMAFRIASGAMLGPDQPVILHLLELPPAMKALQGVVMELMDCAFPLLEGVVATSDLKEGFDGVEAALLVGAKPRGPGMERGDLLKDNGAIFGPQGKALSDVADPRVKVVVVGNPANTNALIAASNAPNLAADQFTALMRLDHDRALSQVAEKTGCLTRDIERMVIWGNHSATQYPDLSHALIGGKWAKEVINDDKWIKDTFIPTVAKRGAAIIDARGASSAASAANAAVAHMRDWFCGSDGQWVSMGLPSDGSYGIADGIVYGVPAVCGKGTVSRVGNVPIDPFSAEMMEKTMKELLEERDAVAKML